MELKPLADRVLIKPAPAEEVTASGIIIAVGNGTKDEEMVLKSGDNVLYGKYAGTEIDLGDGEKGLIMRQNEVLAVVL